MGWVHKDKPKSSWSSTSYFTQRTSYTLREAAAINTEILSFVSEDNVEYISINRVMEEEEFTSNPVEFLESLNALGLAAHRIKLEVGV